MCTSMKVYEAHIAGAWNVGGGTVALRRV
jgi:hypothetical protein